MKRIGRLEQRSGVTRYRQIYSLLERALTDGVIPAGSALPSETQLMATYRVSRNTVRHALAQLEKEKRIVRLRGSGTYARDRTEEQQLRARLSGLSCDLQKFAVATRSRCRRFSWTNTPALVRQHGGEFDDRCLLIERTRSFENVTFSRESAFIAEEAGLKLSRSSVGSVAVLSALAAAGFVPSTALETTIAIGADEVTAELFAVTLQTPVLLTRTFARDGSGRALMFREIVIRTDVYASEMQIRYEWQQRLCWQTSSAYVAL